MSSSRAKGLKKMVFNQSSHRVTFMQSNKNNLRPNYFLNVNPSYGTSALSQAFAFRVYFIMYYNFENFENFLIP